MKREGRCLRSLCRLRPCTGGRQLGFWGASSRLPNLHCCCSSLFRSERRSFLSPLIEDSDLDNIIDDYDLELAFDDLNLGQTPSASSPPSTSTERRYNLVDLILLLAMINLSSVQVEFTLVVMFMLCDIMICFASMYDLLICHASNLAMLNLVDHLVMLFILSFVICFIYLFQ